jgi:hypothetical protein
MPVSDIDANLVDSLTFCGRFGATIGRTALKLAHERVSSTLTESLSFPVVVALPTAE